MITLVTQGTVFLRFYSNRYEKVLHRSTSYRIGETKLIYNQLPSIISQSENHGYTIWETHKQRIQKYIYLGRVLNIECRDDFEIKSEIEHIYSFIVCIFGDTPRLGIWTCAAPLCRNIRSSLSLALTYFLQLIKDVVSNCHFPSYPSVFVLCPFFIAFSIRQLPFNICPNPILNNRLFSPSFPTPYYFLLQRVSSLYSLFSFMFTFQRFIENLVSYRSSFCFIQCHPSVVYVYFFSICSVQ